MNRFLLYSLEKHYHVDYLTHTIMLVFRHNDLFIFFVTVGDILPYQVPRSKPGCRVCAKRKACHRRSRRTQDSLLRPGSRARSCCSCFGGPFFMEAWMRKDITLPCRAFVALNRIASLYSNGLLIVTAARVLLDLFFKRGEEGCRMREGVASPCIVSH